jgi:hypothetical protein
MLSGLAARTRTSSEMTITNQSIERDDEAERLDTILAPVRRYFEASGMTDEDLAALVEEVREDIWRERHMEPKETPPA